MVVSVKSCDTLKGLRRERFTNSTLRPSLQADPVSVQELFTTCLAEYISLAVVKGVGQVTLGERTLLYQR